MKKLGVLLLLFFCLMPDLLLAKTAKRGIFVTWNQTNFANSFEGRTWAFMKAAADDFDLDLTLHKADSRFKFMAVIDLELKSPKKLNFLIMGARPPAITLPMLEKLQKAGVHVYLFNSAIRKEVKPLVGKPRGKFSNWLGNMVPDDEEAGYRLAKLLIKRAKAKNLADKNGKISMIAHSGDRQSSPSRLRSKGLKRALAEHPEVILKQLMWSDWDLGLAQKRTKALMKRYSDTKLIWTASAAMAMGAIWGLDDAKKKPGIDVLVGGMDFEVPLFKEIREGRLEILLGGHFMEGGWVMVLLNDYYKGKDFASKGLNCMTLLNTMTKENIEQFTPYLSSKKWEQIDFKQFSKYHNKELKDYRFDMDELIRLSP